MPSFLNSFVLAAGLSSLLVDSVVADSNNTHERSLVSRRRHHAKIAARQHNVVKKDVSTLVSGLGDGTLYFDINGGGTCGAVNGWSSYAETNGYAMCEPNSGYKTLAQRGTNRIVAMPSNMLAGHQSEYCGKEVVVTYGGKTVDNLILWDGCAACNSNDGLDFSSTVFAEIFGTNNCGAGRMEGMSWKITNKQIWDAATGDPVSSDSGNDDSGDDTPAPAPSSSSSSSWEPEPTSTWSSSSAYSSTSSDDYTPPAAPSLSSSSKAWSESSQWVASTTPSPITSSKSAPVKDVVDPTSSKFQLVVAARPNEIATPTEESSEAAPSSSSSSSSWSASSSSSNSKDEAESTPTSSKDDAPAPLETEQSTVPAAPETSDPSDGAVCNDVPGAWRCAGWSLQQCIQTPGDWTWSTRVSCKIAPINCDSPNPVCASY